MKKLVRKCKYVITTIVSTIAYAVSHFAAPSDSSITGGIGQLVDMGFNIIGLVLGLSGAFVLFSAIQAYGEAKADGGNAQASGKVFTAVAGGLALLGGAALVLTVGKQAVHSMMGI